MSGKIRSFKKGLIAFLILSMGVLQPLQAVLADPADNAVPAQATATTSQPAFTSYAPSADPQKNAAVNGTAQDNHHSSATSSTSSPAQDADSSAQADPPNAQPDQSDQSDKKNDATENKDGKSSESSPKIQKNDQVQSQNFLNPPPPTLPDTFPFLDPVTPKDVKPTIDQSSGALHYTYPFAVTPGKNGLTPDIGLEYNSQNTEESPLVGYGWKLNIPSIERLNLHGSDKLYTSKDFVSSVSGELTEISPNVFGAKTDHGDFLQYAFQNNSFTAKDKNGTTYLYGSTAATRQDDPNDASRIYKWMLEKVTDSLGNSITYHYTKIAGQIYLNTITYGGTLQTPDPFQITFNWVQNNPNGGTSMFISYKTGFYVGNYYHLAQVISNRTYQLNYTTSTNGNGRWMLTSITEAPGYADARTTTFTYQTHPSTWTPNAAWTLPDPLADANMVNGNSIYFESLPNSTELFDINGDALPDEVHAGLNDHFTKLNQGNGWSQTSNWPTVPGAFYDNNYQDRGYRIVDINGDMLSDVLSNDPFLYNDPTYKGALINNNGQFWPVTPTTFSLPESFVTLTSKDSGLRVIDVNGDGLPDLIKSNGFGQNPPPGYTPDAAYINTGTQFVKDNSWIPPVQTLYFFGQCACSFDGGTRFVDINNDGLVDIVVARPYPWSLNNNYDGSLVIQSAIYLNNGHGWTKYQDSSGFNTQLFPVAFSITTDGLQGSCPGSACTFRDNAFNFVDLNGDGLADMARSVITPTLQGPTNLQSESWINDISKFGSGGYLQWNKDDNYKSKVAFIDNNFRGDIGGRIVDVNGDGIADMVNGGYGGLSTQLGDNTVSDLLSTITLPTGGSLQVSYKASTQYHDAQGNLLNPHLPLVVQTVESITESDPFTNLTSTTHYIYEGGAYYYNGPFDRKFAGFERVTTIRPDNSKIITYYHQGNATNAAYFEPSDHLSKMGLSYRQEVFDSQGNLFTRTTTVYDKTTLPSTNNDRFFVYQTQTINETFDGNQTSVATAQTSTYDTTNGNLTSAADYGDVNVTAPNQFTDLGNDRRITNYAYATNGAGQYKIGGIESLGGLNNTKLSSEVYLYDNLPSFVLGKGLITADMRAIDNQNLQIQYFSYDNTGFLLSSTDPFGQVTTYTPDAYDLYPLSIKNPLNQIVQLTYNYPYGSIDSVTDYNNNVTSYGYDIFGRIVNMIFLDKASGIGNNLEYREYKDNGDPANKKPPSLTIFKPLQPNQNEKSVTYFDGFGRPIRLADDNDDSSACIITEQNYDQLGNIAKKALPYSAACSDVYNGFQAAQNLQTNFSYDIVGRPLTATNVLGTTSWTYDDRKATIVAPLNHKKMLTTDALGRLAKVTEYVGNTGYDTNYGYDLNGNLTQITDAVGNIRTFTYDLLGNRLSATDLHAPNDNLYGTITETYEKGTRKNKTTKADGTFLTYFYDALGRLTSKNYDNVLVETYGYDTCLNGKGKLCAVTTSDTLENYTYDTLGREQSETLTTNQKTFSTSYTYDLQGHVLTQTHPNNEVTTFTYTNRGLPKTINHQNNPVITNTLYNEFGSPTSIQYANNKVTAYTYDSAKLFQLKNITTGALQNTNYNFDAVGNLMSENETSPNHPYSAQYGYDDLDRLTSASITAGGQTTNQNYTYDIIGNMVSGPAGNYSYIGNTSQAWGFSYANPHAVTKFGTTDVAYYNNGDVYGIGALAHFYDYNDRLIKVLHTGTGQTLGTYTYTPSGRRVAKFTTQGSNPPGGGVLYTPTREYEVDGANNGTIRFFLGSQEIANLEKPAAGNPVYRYLHPDHLGGTRVITDAAGNEVQTLYYYPFGDIRLNHQAGSFNEKRKFTGHLHDDETNLEYMQARYYNALGGRFLSLDPVYQALGTTPDLSKFLLDPQSLNSYAYARNNPLKYTDPDGRFFFFAIIPIEQVLQYAIVALVGVAAINTSRVVYNSVRYSDPAPAVITDPVSAPKKVQPTVTPSTKEKSSNVTIDPGDESKFCPNITVFPESNEDKSSQIMQKQGENNNIRTKNPTKAESPIWKNLINYRDGLKTNGEKGSKREYYEWDYTHNNIEVYNSRGIHEGVMDPTTGQIDKSQKRNRNISGKL